MAVTSPRDWSGFRLRWIRQRKMGTSVTVVAPDGGTADALETSVYLLGHR